MDAVWIRSIAYAACNGSWCALFSAQAMEPLVWSPNLHVGVREIDSQHQALIQAANDFDVAIQAQRDRSTLERLASGLISQVMNHFLCEERLMAMIRYTDAAGHKAEHTQLMDDLHALRRLANAGGDPGEIRKRLIDWLLVHIGSDDRSLGAALNANGIT